MAAPGALEKSMIPLYLADLFLFINLDKLRVLIRGQYMEVLSFQDFVQIKIGFPHRSVQCGIGI